MHSTAALNRSEPRDDYGLLRRAGRAVLGAAAILIVGAAPYHQPLRRLSLIDG